MSLVAFCVICASVRTSCATTAKPAPRSPARAASTAAFNARRLVRKLTSSIVAIALPISAVTLTDVPAPSLADPFYLVGYGLLVAGLLRAVWVRSPVFDLRALFDPAIITVGAAFFAWVYIAAPAVPRRRRREYWRRTCMNASLGPLSEIADRTEDATGIR